MNSRRRPDQIQFSKTNTHRKLEEICIVKVSKDFIFISCIQPHPQFDTMENPRYMKIRLN